MCAALTLLALSAGSLKFHVGLRRRIEMREYLLGLVFLAVFGGLCRIVERRFPARPQTRLFRGVDLAHWLVGAPIGRALADLAFVVGAFLVLPALLVERFGLAPSQEYTTPFMRLPMAVQIPVAFVFLDFVGYWIHRIQHSSPLWRFHAIHHSSRELDWLASARNHPLAELAGRLLAVPPILLLGIDPRVLAGIIPFVGLWAIFLHANVRWRFGLLRYVIVTPRFHRWHHSRAPEARDKNFAGLLPIWDLLFGTFYLPEHQPDDFGLDDDDAVPEGFLAQMLHPLRRQRQSPPARARS